MVIPSITLRHEWNFFVTTLLTQRDIKCLLGHTAAKCYVILRSLN
jgi:hypothetical protein